MSETQPKDLTKKSALYSAALVVYRALLWLFFGGRIRGRERIPTEGAVILLGNHTNGLDPLTLAACAPHRQLHFIAKAELFRHKWLAALLKALHAFPVGRGQFDMSAMRSARAVIQQRQVLGIFPEGHRYPAGQMGELQSGAAVLALKCDAPVIPVYIDGRYGLFRGLRIQVGEALPLADLRAAGADKEQCDLCLGRMTEAFSALRAQCAEWPQKEKAEQN